MNAGLLLIAGAAGFVTYKVATSQQGAANQPGKEQKNPFWGDWFNPGSQPQTGNGGPTTDQTGKDVANTVTAIAKFGTSLLDYFGGGRDNQSSGGGTSTGGPTNQYSGGGQDW